MLQTPAPRVDPKLIAENANRSVVINFTKLAIMALPQHRKSWAATDFASACRDQFLKSFGMTSGAFDAQQRAGHVALAFGTPIPATAGRYVDLDLVGMAIAAGLAPTLGRQTATTIVLGFFNQWVAAVGHADADTARNYFFAMGAVYDDERRPREILILHPISSSAPCA